MQKIGILGGLGPHTASVFYLDLIDIVLQNGIVQVGVIILDY